MGEIKKNIRDVFGLNIGFDNLQQGQKPLRILPESKIRGRTDTRSVALEWQKRSPIIEQQGDGIKAYLRLAFSLLQTFKVIIFIDEPETFLHPPQRRALGVLVAKLAKESGKQLFIATHDSEFLRGILSSNPASIKIFYLNRKGNIFDYVTFSAREIATLTHFKSNLLTERVLNSFFYKKTILCEDENDRVFYENASALYLWNLFQDTNFIGFNGWKEVLKIFQKLRELGLQAIAIIDIDSLLEPEFSSYISDSQLQDKVKQFKTDFNNTVKLDRSVKKEFKKFGINYVKKKCPRLVSNLRELLESIRSYNIFIVPDGELESWTRDDLRNNWSLQNALNIIHSKTKRKLKSFLKEILTK